MASVFWNVTAPGTILVGPVSPGKGLFEFELPILADPRIHSHSRHIVKYGTRLLLHIY